MYIGYKLNNGSASDEQRMNNIREFKVHPNIFTNEHCEASIQLQKLVAGYLARCIFSKNHVKMRVRNSSQKMKLAIADWRCRVLFDQSEISIFWEWHGRVTDNTYEWTGSQMGHSSSIVWWLNHQRLFSGVLCLFIVLCLRLLNELTINKNNGVYLNLYSDGALRFNQYLLDN